MKFMLAQVNPTVGDIAGNTAMILAAYQRGVEAAVDVVVMPECVVSGYPLGDLVLRSSFIAACEKATDEITQAVLNGGHKTVLIFGSPLSAGHGDKKAVNAAVVVGAGYSRIITKSELPNYGVFDEQRHFVTDDYEPTCVTIRGHKIGVMICEDCWFPRVTEKLVRDGAEMLIAINGSPFEMEKNIRRHNVVMERVAETGLPFLYVNMVGGQDELVFDGGSFWISGTRMGVADTFREQFPVVFVEPGTKTVPQPLDDLTYPIGDVYEAIVLGTRDYFRKQGFSRAVLGMSGGIDSALVAAIAVDALGAANVDLVCLPSKFSSAGSVDHAILAGKRLGANIRTINIEDGVDAIRKAYASGGNGDFLTGTSDENVQARIRGVILMATSNQEGSLLLTTGNKSEVSVGFSTLYGDMNGGFNPIKDCYKTTVWAMSEWRNELGREDLVYCRFRGPAGEVIPKIIITKPPSAELRPDQTDEQSLPPYPTLDAILKGMVEREKSRVDLIAEGHDPATVERVRKLLDAAEYKRRQAAPGVKVTTALFGMERRYPIVNAWRG